AVDAMADGIGAHLAREIDLDCRIDGDHAVVLADQGRVVGAIAGMEFDGRVVVDEVEEAAAAVDEARDDAARMNSLEAVGDRSAIHEVDEPVREHFGVNSEVALVLEGGEDGVRDSADAELEAC